MCHNLPKTAVLPHEDNTAMIHDPVTPPNPLDADYGDDDVVGRFQDVVGPMTAHSTAWYIA